MKTVKLSVFALYLFTIGVALSVTPIFNSAIAQSATDSASVMLELQRLRAEIAELRDMVERQQFELKKLKQSASKQPLNSASPGLAYPGNAAGSPNYRAGTYPADQQSAATDGQPQFPLQTSDQQAIEGFYTAGPRVAGQGGEISARDYNRQTDPSVSGNAANTGVLNNGVQVVDRSITSPRSNPQGANNSAEVIERGIEPYPGSGRAPVLSPNQTPTVDGAANRPVLAVPNDTLAGQGAINPGQAPTPSVTQPNTPNQLSEDQYYDRGFGFLKQSEFDKAINVFNEQIARYPGGELADDAHYWIAEAMFIDRKPAQARPHLRAIIDRYPQSARLPDAMLKTAYIEQDLGNLIEARILLQEIVARHPSSNAAIAAKNRLENLKEQ